MCRYGLLSSVMVQILLLRLKLRLLKHSLMMLLQL